VVLSTDSLGSTPALATVRLVTGKGLLRSDAGRQPHKLRIHPLGAKSRPGWSNPEFANRALIDRFEARSPAGTNSWLLRLP